jgi:hypothetical protein
MVANVIVEPARRVGLLVGAVNEAPTAPSRTTHRDSHVWPWAAASLQVFGLVDLGQAEHP